MANKITTEELLERMRDHTEKIDLGFIAQVCSENNVSISMTWDADGKAELWVNPSMPESADCPWR